MSNPLMEKMLDLPEFDVAEQKGVMFVPISDRIKHLRKQAGLTQTELPGCIPMPETEQVPLVGRIACGTPILVEQNIEAYVPVLSRWHADFALTCEGQSMEPLFQDGDLVAIRKQPSVEQGQVAAVRIGSEVTLKRVYLHQDCIELRPENSAFDSIIKFREEMNEVVIEGRAVGLCRGLA